MSDKNSVNDVTGIALFIDVENYVGLCSKLAVPMAIKPVCEKLKEFGPLRYRRAYGDIARAVRATGGTETSIDFLRKELARSMISIEDVPYIVEHKNSSDICIVTSAMSLAYENEHISHFAFVSQDRDYIPLYSKLKEIGKKTIAVSFDETNRSDMLIGIVDHLFYYENLLNMPNTRFIKEETLNEIGLNEALALLSRVCRKLLDDGKTLRGAAIANLMRQLRSDFEVGRLGFASFLEFLQHAKQKEVLSNIITTSGVDLVVEIPATVHEETAIPDVPKIKKKDSRQIAEEYRNIIREVVKIDLPNNATRKLILESAFNSLTPGISLQDWGFETERSLCDVNEQMFRHYKGLNQIVFKMLLSLYYARCLHAESAPYQGSVANIIVNGIDVPSCSEMNYAFERQIVSTIRLKQGDSMSEEALCLCLYEKLDDPLLVRIRQIIDDISV